MSAMPSTIVRVARAWVARDPRGREHAYHPSCAWFCPPGRRGQWSVVRAEAACAHCGKPLNEEESLTAQRQR